MNCLPVLDAILPSTDARVRNDVWPPKIKMKIRFEILADDDLLLS